MVGCRRTSHDMRFFAMLLFCYMVPCFFPLFNFFIFSTSLIYQHFSRIIKNHDPAVNIAKNCNMGLYKGSRAIRSGSCESAEASALKFDASWRIVNQSRQGDCHAINRQHEKHKRYDVRSMSRLSGNEAQAVKPYTAMRVIRAMADPADCFPCFFNLAKSCD